MIATPQQLELAALTASHALTAENLRLRTRPCPHCGAVAEDTATSSPATSSSPIEAHRPSVPSLPPPPTSPENTLPDLDEDATAQDRAQDRARVKAALRAARYRLRKRSTSPPGAIPPSRSTVTLSNAKRDAPSRSPTQSVTPTPTTRAGFTSSLADPERLGSFSLSGIVTSSPSLLKRHNLTGLDSRARANPTSPTSGTPVTPTSEKPVPEPEPDLDALDPSLGPLDRSSKRRDRQAWLCVDRCAYAFHAARCGSPGCTAAGSVGDRACRSKAHWLGFAPPGRGGRKHLRFRAYDAMLKALGAAMARSPRSSPHERLDLVVEAFLGYVGGSHDGGSDTRPWAGFGALATHAVDHALAMRLRGAQRPRDVPPKRSAADEAKAARQLAADARTVKETLRTRSKRDAAPVPSRSPTHSVTDVDATDTPAAVGA